MQTVTMNRKKRKKKNARYASIKPKEMSRTGEEEEEKNRLDNIRLSVVRMKSEIASRQRRLAAQLYHV